MKSATPATITRKDNSSACIKKQVPSAGYRPYFAPGSFRCKARRYRIPNGDGQHVVYTYIRKNACSSFKALLLNHARTTRKDGLADAKARGLSALREFRPKWWQLRRDAQLFVYRDPFDRCVSAFVNKFVEARSSDDIFANFAQRTGISPATATFEEFVNYINGPFEALDCHVWPQKSHLSETTYTHAIEMQTLNQTMGKLLPSVAPYFSQRANASKWKPETAACDVEHIDLTTTPADQIRELGSYSKANFHALKADVEAKYAMDTEMIADIKKTALTAASNT